jgi:hypothetical protein
MPKEYFPAPVREFGIRFLSDNTKAKRYTRKWVDPAIFGTLWFHGRFGSADYIPGNGNHFYRV